MKTLLHFDLAVILFIIFQSFLGNFFCVFDYVTCWVGWTSVGNSNWYIFVILCLYFFSFIAFTLGKNRVPDTVVASIIIFFSVILWLFLSLTKGKQEWWYNTIAAFPCGILFSLFEFRFSKLMSSMPIFHFGSIILVSLFLILWRCSVGIDRYGVCAVLFVSTVLLITTKIHVGNPLLEWLGKHCFEIYILQRLPMIALEHSKITNPVIFSSISLVVTLFLAWSFKRLETVIDTRLNLL